MYKRILVATDGSQLSKKASRAAIDLAAATGAELVALNVVPRYPTSWFEGALALEPDEVARTESLWADRAQSVVDRVRGDARAQGVKAKALVTRSDDVADAILKAARKNACDLIVMASHGRKGFKRLLLGSETQHVLAHAATPVLVLR